MNFGSPLLDYQSAAQVMQTDTDALLRQVEQLKQRQKSINMQAQVSTTPLFDEIDKIEDSLTDTLRQFLMQNQEYAESLQYVSKIVQDEILRIVRPRIEQTEQGKEALKHHLSIVTRLKKEFGKEEERKQALLDDYVNNHPDMSYKDYIAMVNKKGGKK